MVFLFPAVLSNVMQKSYLNVRINFCVIFTLLNIIHLIKYVQFNNEKIIYFQRFIDALIGVFQRRGDNYFEHGQKESGRSFFENRLFNVLYHSK